MLVTATTLTHRWITPFSGIRTPPPLTPFPYPNQSLHPPLRLPTSSSLTTHFNPYYYYYCTNKSHLPQLIHSTSDKGELVTEEEINRNDWLPAFPHILVASMSNFLFGFHIGVMNGPILSIAKELGFEGNSILEGLVVSIFIAGAFLGSAGAGYVVDRFGFRRTLQVDTLPLILGAILRMLYSLIVLFLKAGRLDDAKKVISNLWGPSEVEKSIEEFQSVLKNDGGDLDSSWSELLEEPHSRVAFIGGALFVLQQFAGINAVLYFSSLTFKDAGITNGALASLYVGLTNFAGALCGLYLVDRQGRQKLIIGSYLGMAISMFLVVYAISFPIDDDLRSNLSILGTILYMLTYAIGAGPVTGLIIPELSSSRTRGKIMSFSFSVHWVCNFLVGLFFLDLTENFGVAPVYGSFGVVSILASIFSYSFLVETKGRSLEEIEISLNSNFAKRD
ncbi:hypothetical protein M8C21_006628 [Ambrosia artemisiifolia]|uniref:Major facilitator superfamily (MFS) profile domain-containing protein n=1 Tax=Ambrosia artemisiifolia TaxID=4212 RepID=A0AAD5BRF3_AMBAR|nr:hypothetical protein M8C21_006628 [Ambrosia artemisiifolia]